jgi:competence protein ComEC
MLLVYLAAAWSAGIAAASFLAFPIVLWLGWLILPVALLVIWWRDPLLRRAHLCLLVFLLGALRYAFAVPVLDDATLASLNQHGAVLMIGNVIDPPEVRDQTTNVRVAMTRVQVDRVWRDLSGAALVQVPRETDVRYGDQVQIYGEPTTPPENEDFSYKEYLARQGIHSLIRYSSVKVLARDQGNPFFTALYAFRDRALATINAILPDPAASLLAGILLGVESGIPREVNDAFSATNTAHIIAISGFNIAIIAGILSKLTERVVGARRATFIVIAGLVVYTLLVGAGASVVRAAIMGSLSVLALHYHRQNDALNALAVAALLMTAWNPLTLFDLGFQLSLLATLGLILYVTPLSNAFESTFARVTSSERARQIVRILNDSFIVTLAAQITTTPLIVFTFHRLSVIGLLANLVVLPAQPAVMIWGGIATLTAMIIQPLGQMIAWIAWAFLEFTIAIVQWTATLPLASIPIGRFDAPLLAAYYLALFGATRGNWRALFSRVTLRPAIALGIALVAGMWLWSLALTAPDGKTHVQFIDAGSAATFVRAPRGSRILIDGGANPSAVLSTLGRQMPFWERSLDLLVLTNADDAHLAGLVDVLERYDIRQIIQVSAPAKPSAAYSKWRDLISQKRVPSLAAQAGLIVSIDRDVTLEILYPGEDAPSAQSAIVCLRAGGIPFLFADGIDADEQSAWIASDIGTSSPVLIAPRQVTPEFASAVGAQFAVLFVGSGARDKPSGDSLAALAPATILRTDERGGIEMIADGQTLAVRTER